MEHPFYRKRKKPVKVSPLLMPIYLPLLFVAAVIAVPWNQIRRLRIRQQEKRFADLMHARGRLMTWEDAETRIDNREGTIVGEYLSIKGPYRLWWTSENISELSPVACSGNEDHDWLDPQYAPFFEWCWNRYTNPENGIAVLVQLRGNRRVLLKDKIKKARYVSSCSFKPKRDNL
jgi:hypothetical protein